jgi:CubicO group peptidase (beta-lactamase class C family)
MNSVREQQITLYHLLSMTTGMDNRLNRVSEPGREWSYNTPAYHYLKKVLEAVTQQSLHTLTKQWITKPLGMKSTSWIDRVYMNLPDGTPMSGLHTNVRDLARFGLLILNDGKWAGNTIFKDKAYLKEALSSSQDMNAAYGYLWWLNGKSHYMLPRAKYTRKGYLIPPAPTDLVAAFGVKAQKLYIVPSLSLVVARRGSAPTGTNKSSFGNSLWERLMHAAPRTSR